MVLFPIFEMVMVRSDCDPTFPFRRLNFLYLDFLGKLKVPEPSLDWVFILILSAKTNRTIVSHVSYPSRKCTSLFDLNFSGLWIYILVLSHLPIFIEKRKRKVGQHFCWSCVLESFLQKRETRRLPPKGVSTSGSTLSTFFLRKFLREGQCSTALAQGNN